MGKEDPTSKRNVSQWVTVRLRCNTITRLDLTIAEEDVLLLCYRYI